MSLTPCSDSSSQSRTNKGILTSYLRAFASAALNSSPECFHDHHTPSLLGFLRKDTPCTTRLQFERMISVTAPEGTFGTCTEGPPGHHLYDDASDNRSASEPPESECSVATLVTELPPSHVDSHPKLQAAQQGLYSEALAVLQCRSCYSHLIPSPPPYVEEGHLHPFTDPHHWSWLDCPDGLQVFLPPRAAIEYSKFLWALENDIHNLSTDYDFLYFSFDDMYEHISSSKPKHPVRGIVPSDGCFALPWGWSCLQINQLVSRYELIRGSKIVPLLSSGASDAGYSNLNNPDNDGRRWLSCENGFKFLLSSNVASQYSILDTILAEAPSLQSWHAEALHLAAQELIKTFPSECHAYAIFEGVKPRDGKHFAIDAGFRSSKLERLIWDFETILAGCESDPSQFCIR